ncbi:uracil-DNA glycosylase family protein [Gallaecimonas mangrovi]|uniref:uracil-DNA glycosylase family protein n=1 Tax=Gallaecimonas mangrovi TaxID=2291597 RepID=UPI000E1FFB15|nr:uracil-DNA glycosylase family protein [Gallaecimonas mangrovi]
MTDLTQLLSEVSQCQRCSTQLPLGPRPVVKAAAKARLLIIGQAPGTRVHATGIPFNDPSGDRLRQWLQMTDEQFYNPNRVAIMPMGFCYPGKGKSGDLPPRPECAPTWHQHIMARLPHIELVLLIGRYAQDYYLADKRTLTERVKHFADYGPRYFPLPHPSPRNLLWLKRNPWFDTTVLPALQSRLQQLQLWPSLE